jgi:hypothetical protein
VLLSFKFEILITMLMVLYINVGNQHKWDSLGPERSGVGKSLGELPEGPVMKSSPIDRLSLHLLSAL